MFLINLEKLGGFLTALAYQKHNASKNGKVTRKK